jgi:hypothetical protein
MKMQLISLINFKGGLALISQIITEGKKYGKTQTHLRN